MAPLSSGNRSRLPSVSGTVSRGSPLPPGLSGVIIQGGTRMCARKKDLTVEQTARIERLVRPGRRRTPALATTAPPPLPISHSSSMSRALVPLDLLMDVTGPPTTPLSPQPSGSLRLVFPPSKQPTPPPTGLYPHPGSVSALPVIPSDDLDKVLLALFQMPKALGQFCPLAVSAAF